MKKTTGTVLSEASKVKIQNKDLDLSEDPVVPHRRTAQTQSLDYLELEQVGACQDDQLRLPRVTGSENSEDDDLVNYKDTLGTSFHLIVLADIACRFSPAKKISRIQK